MLFFVICFLALQGVLGYPAREFQSETGDKSPTSDVETGRTINLQKFNPFYWISGDSDDGFDDRFEKIEKRLKVLYELITCSDPKEELCKRLNKLAEKLFKKKGNHHHPGSKPTAKPGKDPKPETPTSETALTAELTTSPKPETTPVSKVQTTSATVVTVTSAPETTTSTASSSTTTAAAAPPTTGSTVAAVTSSTTSAETTVPPS